MVPVPEDASAEENLSRQSVGYIRQMLAELRGVADEQGADMLRYLLEMAYVEAGDILAGRRSVSIGRPKGDQTAGVPVKSSGKI